MTNKDVIIACDFSSAKETYKFLDLFDDAKPYVKIGMELYYAEGPSIVKEIKSRGHKIFLDLKLHDIPNTVGKAMKNLADMGVDMTNVHAAGGAKMMQVASAALEGTPTKLIAVTQLTSTSTEVMHDELLIDKNMPIKDVVTKYALLAKQAGLCGVVCSPLEAGEIKKSIGDGFLTITPGIRFAEDSKGDQVRITTPSDAKRASDYIVVGRSITASPNPVEAYKRCVQDFLGE